MALFPSPYNTGKRNISELSITPPVSSRVYGLSFMRLNMFSHIPMARMKYRLTSPHATPSSMHAGMRSIVHLSSRKNVKSESLPTNMYVKQVAVTHEMSMGSSEAMLRSTMSTSSVNTRPAMGALNIPAMAAAAPHPTSSMSVLLSIRKSCPRLEPIAEPVSTIGASAPTEPPNPMVMAEAITDDQQLWALRCERLVEMAYNMRVIPCEMLSFTTYFTNSIVMSIPMTGNRR